MPVRVCVVQVQGESARWRGLIPARATKLAALTESQPIFLNKSCLEFLQVLNVQCSKEIDIDHFFASITAFKEEPVFRVDFHLGSVSLASF